MALNRSIDLLCRKYWLWNKVVMLHATCRTGLWRHCTLSRANPLPVSVVSVSTACSSGKRHISSSLIRASSDSTNHGEHTPHQKHPTTDKPPTDTAEPAKSESKSKSVTQADQELRERLEQMSGEGGAAGIEYEDGKPASMKRSVRNNMFRYI
ncbi:hypothetical protein BDW42DRAFT_167608 [Aspergillus taichungensis]|uniref:Uncharacterized protein n=1 Tax=Aspergillus taichungensis TaxID=482145 RepID=A0A2J5HXJ0_9EURO|nr:hypothetical protein BDW42DRAFT_167608 [Aspergillus taichungensis]